MIAVTLVVLVAIDTAISGYMLAKVKHLQSQITAQARVIRDLSDCLADMEEDEKDDAE